MGKGLASLIRLRRWRLDEERRGLAHLLRAADDTRVAVTSLDAEIERERRSADDPEFAFAFAAYAVGAKNRREAAVEARERAEAAVTAHRDVVIHCHREMRSAELVEQARRERLAEERRHRDQTVSDELAILKQARQVKC